MKCIYKNPTVTILNDEIKNAVPLPMVIGYVDLFAAFLFNTVPEVLANTRQKKVKGIKIRLELETIFITDNMIAYTETPKKSTQKDHYYW